MARSILPFVAGLVAWVLVASVLNRGLRLAFGGYAAAEPQMAFTPQSVGKPESDFANSTFRNRVFCAGRYILCHGEGSRRNPVDTGAR